jgi:hypothetical protein
MGTKIVIKHSFSSSNLNLDKLKRELISLSIPFDMVASLDNQGEFEDFTDEFNSALEDRNVEASMHYDPGRMYMSNGDPGYPEESYCEDVVVERIQYKGKLIDITDCLTEKGLEEVETELWDKYNEPDYFED